APATQREIRGMSTMSNPPNGCVATRRHLLLAGVLALLAACHVSSPLSTAPDAAAPDPVEASVWLTTSDHAKALSPMPAATFGAQPPLPIHIRIDPDHRYQRMLGFGAAITDASAWLIRHRMSPAQRDALLRELFGREGEGIGFDFTRLTIGASDFSRRHCSLDDVPEGETDPQLRHFSIAPNRDDVIPVTRA